MKRGFAEFKAYADPSLYRQSLEMIETLLKKEKELNKEISKLRTILRRRGKHDNECKALYCGKTEEDCDCNWTKEKREMCL